MSKISISFTNLTKSTPKIFDHIISQTQKFQLIGLDHTFNYALSRYGLYNNLGVEINLLVINFAERFVIHQAYLDEILKQNPKQKIIVLLTPGYKYNLTEYATITNIAFLSNLCTIKKFESALNKIAKGKGYTDSTLEYLTKRNKIKIPNKEHSIKKKSSTRTSNIILSVKEMEILRFISAGLTSKAIAERLGISKRTVDQHRYIILKKYGCSNMQQVLLIWRNNHTD